MAITVNGAAGATSITQLSVGTSADLASIISNESGTGVLVFNNTPTITSPVIGGTVTTASGNLVLDPFTEIVEIRGNGSTVGQIQLNCPVNTHGQKIASQLHAESATNTLTLPGGNTIGNSNAVLVSNTGTQTLTNKTISAGTLTGTLTAGGSAGTAGQVLTSTGTGVEYTTLSAGTTANDQAFAFAVQVFT